METKKTLTDYCINFLKAEETKKELHNILTPILEYFLKEIHIYLCFFLFFIFSSFILHLGVLILLIQYNNKLKKQSLSK
uniref:Uncharacterized protein n=1 Tax=viral metagenome TaxID=1070528 RepID=A0A6C0H453_9ZZZZ